MVWLLEVILLLWYSEAPAWNLGWGLYLYFYTCSLEDKLLKCHAEFYSSRWCYFHSFETNLGLWLSLYCPVSVSLVAVYGGCCCWLTFYLIFCNMGMWTSVIDVYRLGIVGLWVGSWSVFNYDFLNGVVLWLLMEESCKCNGSEPKINEIYYVINSHTYSDQVSCGQSPYVHNSVHSLLCKLLVEDCSRHRNWISM